MVPRRAGLVALAALAMPATGRGQGAGWPNDRPIEVIVPVPPGGGLDTMARLVMPHVVARLGPGARFVTVNRPGAGSQIGIEAVFAAAPDGYTLGAISCPALPAMPIERQVRYRTAEFAWIANVVDDPNAFFVLAASPLRTLADLAAAARARPGTLSYGSTGIGGDDHIAMLSFEEQAGLPPMVHVPFTGSAPALQTLLTGNLDVLVGNVSEQLALLREGRLRALGAAAPARVGLAPEIPTFREQGIELVAGASRGFIAGPGLPVPIRARFEAAFAAALADPAFLREAERVGMPLRPLIGPAYAAMIGEMEASLRQLWHRRPWRD
ncbi:tripartite tricarboxylate transporter substrate binding protein [Paracraurococcus lichenis]|uniref:Tripartite tricarboxylate transporter substrate binding protein n=1 Tax=Paracraurococcus lichenis TaxID=3064888 RepID=A0ABT9DTH7_9PROT|nr:tripartite tricarboxylate transporter substrate binding protein [Paracraurococcus sp. LOR1-02]MDO9707188.1 tripartite tricarboxylate transporter substrate binding protein [Paracraurococcus sp. LOR1-02]